MPPPMPPPPPYCATARLEMPTIRAATQVNLRTLFNINCALSVLWFFFLQLLGFMPDYKEGWSRARSDILFTLRPVGLIPAMSAMSIDIIDIMPCPHSSQDQA